MVSEEFACLRTINKVLEQQTFLLDHPAKELKDRIVSLPRPYVRPIIRGKENKRVEFGNRKNHYGLRKIRVKGEKKEKLMVFFATMTVNAVKITKRRENRGSPPLEKAA